MKYVIATTSELNIKVILLFEVAARPDAVHCRGTEGRIPSSVILLMTILLRADMAEILEASRSALSW